MLEVFTGQEGTHALAAVEATLVCRYGDVPRVVSARPRLDAIFPLCPDFGSTSRAQAIATRNTDLTTFTFCYSDARLSLAWVAL